MNLSTPPTAQMQEPDMIAAAAAEAFDAQAAAEAIRNAISGWFERTQQTGFRIPFVSDLLARVIGPPAA
jgi:hypothetical protein